MGDQREPKSTVGSKTISATHRGQALTITTILLAVAGTFISLQLTHLHYKVNTDPDFMSFCNIGDAVNCETVAASAYSQVFGVPVAVWGCLAYLVLLGLALSGARAARAARYPGLPGLIVLWALAGMVCTAVLAYISTFLIESFCVLCVMLYLINLTILGLSFPLATRTSGSIGRAVRADLRAMRQWPKLTGIGALTLGAVVGALLLFYPQIHLTSVAAAPVIMDDGCGSNLRTADGHPMVGAKDALVTIIEFSDYQCGHCRGAHWTLRRLVDEYDGKVRLVHRHYPLDNSCNPHIPRPFHRYACLAARATICADEQGKFWEMNDILYENPRHLERKHLAGYARQLDLDLSKFEACLVSSRTEEKLREDIHAGTGWGVRGTPAFVINGRLVTGGRSKEAFREEIENAMSGCPESDE